MKKTVIYEFPDDFKFPEYYGQKNIEKTHVQKLTYHTVKTTYETSSCYDCPLRAYADDYCYCGLTGDDEDTPPEERHECPFFRGQETAVH